MDVHAIPRCPTCGEELVLEVDPPTPVEVHADVLPADPPYRYVCPTRDCLRVR